MELNRISFRGIETQSEITNGIDGTCSRIKNLVPYGPMRDNPSWKPIEIGDNKAVTYPMGIATDFGSPNDVTVLAQYWHVRKQKEQSATKTDLNRWLLLIYYADDSTYKLYATKVTSGEHRIDGDAIATFTAANWQGDFKYKWQAINSQDVALLIYNETDAHQFFIIGDSVYNGHIHQKENRWICDTDSDTYMAADFPNGGYPGYLPLADKYFSLMLVWRLETTGTFIKHTAPKVVTIAQDNTKTYWPTLIQDANAYVNSSDYTDRLLLSNEKTDEIGGPYVALTVGYGAKEDALNTADYYVVGLVEDFEKDADNTHAIKIVEDNIATYEILNIDPNSHHIITGRAFRNIRGNLLQGDLITNFHLPAAEWWFTEPLTNPALVSSLLNNDHNDVYNDWTYSGMENKVLLSEYVRLINTSGTGYVEKTGITPVNTTGDILITIEYDIYSLGSPYPTVDVTGTGIVDSTGNNLDEDLGTDTRSIKQITIPAADVSTTAPITVRINFTTAGASYYLEVYSVTVVQKSVSIIPTSDIVEVVISKPEGEFKRYQEVLFYEDSTDIYMPEVFSYPDRDATQIKLWRLDSGTWYNYYTVNLKAHPTLNIAYNQEDDRSFEITGVTSSVDTTSDPFNKTGQNSHQRRSAVMRAANLNEFDWPLSRYYTVNSKVTGFVDNTDQVGDGQFGQYPIYIMCEDHIHAAESSADIFISKIELISDDYGCPYAEGFAKMNNTLWFVSKTGLHILRGASIEDIHYPLRNYISNGFLEDTFIAEECWVLSNRKTKEVLFVNSDYILCFNTEFGQWYDGEVNLTTDLKGMQVGDDAYIVRQDGGNNGATFNEDFIAKWRDGSDEVDVILETNPMNFNFYGILKRFFRGVVLGRLNSSGSGSGITVTLSGKKTGDSSYQELCKYVYTDVVDIQNLLMRSNYGSMHVYKFKVEGLLDVGSYVQELSVEFENRGGRILK